MEIVWTSKRVLTVSSIDIFFYNRKKNQLVFIQRKVSSIHFFLIILKRKTILIKWKTFLSTDTIIGIIIIMKKKMIIFCENYYLKRFSVL